METAIDGNGKRSATRRRTYLGIAVALVVVVGAAWVAIDRSGGNDKSQRSGALVTTAGEYKNVELVAKITTAGVAVDAYRNVYVSQTYDHLVKKCVLRAAIWTCSTVAGGNGEGSAANQLIEPLGVAVDGDGNLYVADGGNNRVQKFASGCTSTCPGVTVVSGGGPTGVAVDAGGNVYVADGGNDRVQKCVPSATVWTCSTLAGGNGVGSAANQLDDPSGVAVDASGNVYVADTYNNRVQKCVPSATVWTCSTVAGGNGVGSAANQLSPVAVAVDLDGNVYVADYNYYQWELPVRIQKWAPGATEGTTVVAGTNSTSVENQLYVPYGVAVDTARNLYVADYEGWVHKWSP